MSRDTDAGRPQTEAFSPVADAGGRLFLQSLTAAEAGDAAMQAAAILRKADALLDGRGAGPGDVRKLVVALTDGADRDRVKAALRAHFPGGLPCLTMFVATGLADPEARVQMDVDALRGGGPVQSHAFPHSDGAATVARSGNEIFLSAIHGLTGEAAGGSLAEAAAQARRAMDRLGEALEAVGAGYGDVCKITVHVPDRHYREAVYPEIGRRLGDVYPVSTGLIVQNLVHPQALFAIDVLAEAGNGRSHRRERRYHTSTTLYGEMRQALDCGFCMSIAANERVFLRGQTGMSLDGVLHGQGDVVAQTEMAMANVATLLADVDAGLRDVRKAVLFVTDPAYLDPCRAVIARHLDGVAPAFSEVVVKGLAAPDLLMEVDILALRQTGA